MARRWLNWSPQRRGYFATRRSNQRRSAAWLITYAPDKRSVIEDLISAGHDPDPEVRNIVVRSIILIAQFANKHPNVKIARLDHLWRSETANRKSFTRRIQSTWA